MDYVEQLNGLSCLVRFQMPDQVPLRRISFDLDDLRLCLLHLVLTENGAARNQSCRTTDTGCVLLTATSLISFASLPECFAATAIRSRTVARLTLKPVSTNQI